MNKSKWNVDADSKARELTHTFGVAVIECAVQGGMGELVADMRAHSHSAYTQSQNAQRVLVVVGQGTIADWMKKNKNTQDRKQDLIYTLASLFAL